MRTSTRWLLATAISVALASLLVHASQPAPRDGLRDTSDLLPDSRRRALAVTARDVADAKAVTAEDVGDVDSFGRNVTWLGVTQMNVRLDPSTCPKPDPAADAACAVLAPAPALTSFDLQDVARIVLPAKASKTLLCHWLSPVLTVRYANTGAAPVVAHLGFTPTLTVENPVLDDPALIDPTTGAPFAGRLTTGMTASERFEVPLQPGMAINARERDSATCIAGFVTRRSLIDQYGLPPELADKFFAKKTTVRMNLRGTAQHVASADLVFGLRIVGD